VEWVASCVETAPVPSFVSVALSLSLCLALFRVLAEAVCVCEDLQDILFSARSHWRCA